MRRSREAGVTLMEVLIAVSLLSLLSLGMVMAMRVGLNALSKGNERLMDNRRVAGVERILKNQIAGMIPVVAQCAAPEGGGRQRMPFFQGEPQTMRLVSSYSLAEAWRGLPQILEFLVIPGAEGRGVRLVVNELPYTGPMGAGALCFGRGPDPLLGIPVPRFAPVEAGPRSFVLADKLAACRFFYLQPPPMGTPPPAMETWQQQWTAEGWPMAVRVEMEPLDPNPVRLHPAGVTVPLAIRRPKDFQYVDF